MATDTLGNQRVDFVWGNMPMQPDTGRSTPLNKALDSHSIADVGWSGYPGFIPNDNDDIVNVLVPDIVGLAQADADDALVAAGLISGTVTTADNAAGATALNDGKVKTQGTATGTSVNTGVAVAYVVYEYTP